MPKPEVWFAIPSASPDKCRAVLPIWKKMGYRIAVLQGPNRADIPADICVWTDSYVGWAHSVNFLCKEVVPASCQIVVTGGDDMLPDPNHTADELAEQFLNRFPNTFGVMQPHGDEYLASRRYCGSPFLGRAWIDTMYAGAGPFFGNYFHNWADNELYWVARGLGALWERPDLSHFHDHFTRSGRTQPTYWKNIENRDLDDCLLYYSRAMTGFAGHEPLPTPATTGRVLDSTQDRSERVVLAKQRMLGLAIHNPYASALAGALERCGAEGLSPVAIYGMGAHTRIGGAALCQPSVPIECIVDDNPTRHGTRAWNIPIVSAQSALSRGVKAVILSAVAVEDDLWAKAQIFRDAGVPVIRLYAPRDSGSSSSAASDAGTERVSHKIDQPGDECVVGEARHGGAPLPR
jgi:hypothetical protein